MQALTNIFDVLIPVPGEEMTNDVYNNHFALYGGILLLTDMHCIYAKYNNDASERVNFTYGYQEPLEPLQVKSCVLAWHASWKDLGAVEVCGSDVVLQVRTFR
jgi:hypothetical protein